MKVVPVVFAVALATSAFPQARFDVASIRPSPPAASVNDARSRFVGNLFEVHAYTVGDILDMLTPWQLYRVTGGPEWMRTDRYDISARSDHEIATAVQGAAVMALLSERFHLKSHHESREMPVLVLRSRASLAHFNSAAPDEKYSRHPDGKGHLTFTATPIGALTNFLEQGTQTPVVDETGLKGVYDFVISTADIPPLPGDEKTDRVRAAVEALGFRVENRREAIDITVVDRCERPTAN